MAGFPNSLVWSAALKRLHRLRQLRAMNAPLWIIKSEQVALVLAREGLKHRGLGAGWSKRQDALYQRHVVPLLDAYSEGYLNG